jgi:hypothetical protein
VLGKNEPIERKNTELKLINYGDDVYSGADFVNQLSIQSIGDDYAASMS